MNPAVAAVAAVGLVRPIRVGKHQCTMLWGVGVVVVLMVSVLLMLMVLLLLLMLLLFLWVRVDG